MEELVCNDSEDNDGDGENDCSDTDCAEVRACQPIQAFIEEFRGLNGPFDLLGRQLIFTVSPDEPNGYTYATVERSVFPDEPGSSANSAQLALFYQDTARVPLEQNIELFGVSHEELYVVSDGYITFEEPFIETAILRSLLSRRPTVATAFTFLDPEQGGAITVDQFDDHVTVSFVDIRTPHGTENDPRYTFQTRIFHSGDIDMTWLAADEDRTVVVGISSGGTNTMLDTNFVE